MLRPCTAQQRDLTMQKFRRHVTQLLVATDVAARGLDVDDLTHVINYGLPDDIENYTHRSGRTGRAGKKGTSISIVHTREKHKIRAIEKEIGKEFVEGDIPTAAEICKKQLYKVMDQILKTDVEEEQIAPFMQDISRYFEYIDKEDIIKKIVSVEFGKFLAYYADAPEIEKPASKKKERGAKGEERGARGKEQGGRSGSRRKAEAGYRRLFINLGKTDGFYPGEVMQFLNKHVKGRQEVGHIDLLSKFSYIEVPEKDANKVMKALNGVYYKNREVRCNDADDTQKRGGKGDARGRKDTAPRGGKEASSRGKKAAAVPKKFRTGDGTGDWRELMKGQPFKFRGEEPDFSEEGWARRRPKK